MTPAVTPAMTPAILALNAGSSSLKFTLFEAGARLRVTSTGEIEGIGAAPHFLARDPAGATLAERRWPEGTDHQTLLREVLSWVGEHLDGGALVAVGHRVVHGGRDFTQPVRVTPAVLDALDGLTPLAPLHQPHSLEPIRALMALQPDLPQVACFDTAFHATMPDVATRFALPRALAAEGVRRYGFHGLSYEFIAGALRDEAPHLATGRVVVAHLGNGASLCAMQDGRSVDTTMGFTALDGLVMGTRCGSIDPGLVLYLIQQKGLSPQAVEDMLYRRSGLLGISGVSSDMRVLLASADPHAAEAVESFVFHVSRHAAALAASLGGIDAVVFTAGIGEHAADVRALVCQRMAWLGIALDPAANATHTRRISTPDSRVEVLVIPTDEAAVIARHTRESLGV